MNERPSVAHFVSPYLFLTGSWIHGQLAHMRQYRPIVVTHRTENLDIFPFAPIYAYESVSAVRKMLLCAWRGRRRGAWEPFTEWVVRRNRPVLLHAHFGTTGVSILGLRARTRLPLVTRFYGADGSQVPRDPVWLKRYERLFAEGELFLAGGRTMRDRLLDLGCPPEKAEIQPLGVDLEQFRFVPRQIDSSGVVRVLVAGTFREKKGIPDALRAIELVRRRYHRISVTLIGDSADKPGDEEEKKEILGLLGRLDGIVEWIGFQQYPAFKEALMRHHLFLSPSRTARDGDSEGGAPVSIIEAQATGMPIVSTFHADIPEVVKDGESGYLSAERDVEALAANLERIVADPACWDRMGRAGRAHIERSYNIRTHVDRLEELYSRVAGRLH